MEIPAVAPLRVAPSPALAGGVGAAAGLALWFLTSSSTGLSWSDALRAALVAAVAVVALAVVALGAFTVHDRRLNGGALLLAMLVALSAATAEGFAALALPAIVAGVGGATLQAASAAGSWRVRSADVGRSLGVNATVLTLAAVVAGVFLGLLVLGGALFRDLGFWSVAKFLESSPLSAGALGAVFALAVVAPRARADVTGRALLVVLGGVLPAFALLIVAFLIALPAALLTDPLRLYGGLLSSGPFLCLTAGALAVLAAAWGSGDAAPRATFVRRFTRLAFTTLPVLPALAMGGLGIRANIHGLTEDRVFGLALAAWLFAWSGAVAYGTRRDPWFGGLGRVNAAAALLLGGLALASSVPGLRPVDFAVRSQLARLVAPDAPADVRAGAAAFLAHDAHRTGRAALERFANSAAPGDGARRLARLALANSSTDFWRAVRRPTSVTLRLLGGPPLPDAGRRAVERRLWRREDLERFCPAVPAPCEATVVTVNGAPLHVLVFDTSFAEDAGRWYDLRGEAIVAEGPFDATLRLDDATGEPDLRVAARSATEDELRVRVVRVGRRTLFLQADPAF